MKDFTMVRKVFYRRHKLSVLKYIFNLLMYIILFVFPVSAFAIDDYPYPNACTYPCTDPWGFYNRECTSFVAWRMNRDANTTSPPYSFTNDMSNGHWGNAGHWDENAQFLGFTVNTTPTIGAIAQWNENEVAGGYGHVAYVESINPDSSVNISEYNYNNAYAYGERTNVNAPRYIHINTLNDGLVAYYPFNGNANDESGNGNNGTVYGATLTTDRFGNANSAYSFDGVNDYIETSDLYQPGTGELTIQAWVKPSINFQSGTPRNQITSHFWGPHQFQYYNGSLVIEIYDSVHHLNLYSFPVNLIADNWYHFVFTAKAEGNVYLFINNNKYNLGNTPLSIEETTNKLHIGKEGKNRYYFNGVIDDVRIYSQALTDAEIQALYNESIPDADGDGYPATVDCNDNDPTVNPGATEGPYGNPTCSDLKDNDCDGLIDAADSGCKAPDLLVSTWTAPANACPGASISIKDTTKNQGTGLAGASTTKFYLSTNTTLDAGDTPLGSRTVPSLTAGAINTETTSVTLPTVPTGKYYIIVMADDGKAVKESNETNNKKTKIIYIGPDLIVSALSAPTSATVGTPFSVKVTTKNKGCGSTVNTSYTKVYLTSGSASGLPQSLTVPPLGTSAINTQTITVTISTPGTYYINAQADSTNTVVEASETNNKKSRKIVIY